MIQQLIRIAREKYNITRHRLILQPNRKWRITGPGKTIKQRNGRNIRHRNKKQKGDISEIIEEE